MKYEYDNMDSRTRCFSVHCEVFFGLTFPFSRVLILLPPGAQKVGFPRRVHSGRSNKICMFLIVFECEIDICYIYWLLYICISKMKSLPKLFFPTP